jgi:hypothetical protein
MTYLWLPMAICGALTLARALIDWHGHISYEKTRAACVAALLKCAPPGAVLRDIRRDGMVLDIGVPARQAYEDPGRTKGEPGRPAC